MNQLRLSMTTRKLLDAAKADVPSATARANMWTGLSGAVGAGVSGATTSAVMNGTAGTTKLLAIGGLFGGALVVGLAAVLLKIGSPSAPAPIPHTASPVAPAAFVTIARPPSRESTAASTSGRLPSAATSRSATPDASTTRIRSKPATPTSHEDSLAREASLVTEARGALGHGDPGAALRAIRAARALPSRQLMPEELAVEEQALRALGQSDQANGIDVQLRLQYPESALAR